MGAQDSGRRGHAGRPSKLTPERMQVLLQALERGQSRTAACALAGIHYQTFLNWLERGQREGAGEFFEFFERVRQAESVVERLAVEAWVAAFATDWHAARDFLARRFPADWAERREVQHTGPDRGPIEFVARRAEPST